MPAPLIRRLYHVAHLTETYYGTAFGAHFHEAARRGSGRFPTLGETCWRGASR
jgi:hypothetical protein